MDYTNRAWLLYLISTGALPDRILFCALHLNQEQGFTPSCGYWSMECYVGQRQVLNTCPVRVEWLSGSWL